MLARKLISVGRMRCPRPWRARNATLRPSSEPSTKASEVSPNGVCTVTSRTSVSPGMEYRPLPPIMPISACCKESLLQEWGKSDYSEDWFIPDQCAKRIDQEQSSINGNKQ